MLESQQSTAWSDGLNSLSPGLPASITTASSNSRVTEALHRGKISNGHFALIGHFIFAPPTGLKDKNKIYFTNFKSHIHNHVLFRLNFKPNLLNWQLFGSYRSIWVRMHFILQTFLITVVPFIFNKSLLTG